jgi:hypothetical protein
MVADPSTSDVRALLTIRRLLIVTLLVGMVGTAGELLLLGHFGSPLQVVPLVLLGLGLAAVVWQLAAPRAESVRALQMIAILFLAAGVTGVGLHYDGNAAFELDMYPSRAGVELARKALTGATPVLAPGSMTLLGLVAAAYTYKHPALGAAGPGRSKEAV